VIRTLHSETARPSPDTSLARLHGVGPALVKSLAKLGLEQLADLWFHLPLRYEDRTHLTSIAALRAGCRVLVEGSVMAVEDGFHSRRELRVSIADDSASILILRYLHCYRGLAERFVPGRRVRCYGEVRQTGYGLEMIHPEVRVLHGGEPLETSLSPVYPVTKGISHARMSNLVARSLACLPPAESLELLSPEDLHWLELPNLRTALQLVHRPPPTTDVQALLLGTHPARRRLSLEELLAQHLGLRRIRQQVRSFMAPAIEDQDVLRARMRQGLGFELTGAQQRVTGEILDNLRQPRPMLRLIQGDVGSGKTAVAAQAALAVIEAGYQVAMVAPTELLAEQHYRSFTAWFEPLGLETVWLAGKVKGRARLAVLQRLASGVPMVVGTHALMQQGVLFLRLALVIVDEQHRFGVQQRLALAEKGAGKQLMPHQLVLTATPIPRTLAMTAYADLDISIVDELPPGRTPIRTVVLSDTRREEVIERIRLACSQGRQAYWVCTLIDESEVLQAKAAENVYSELCEALPGLPVGKVHGRMRAKDKQAVMDAFKSGEIKLLVATTVIEVGVDVSNASLMVIENAERLGLAQLHQLRGRVGRGSQASSCVLLYAAPLSAIARARLTLLRNTGDGFKIAEMDLQLRGPGEVLGTRQTGELVLKVADLQRDTDMLPLVRELADRLLKDDPQRAERIVRRWMGTATRFAGA